MQEKKEYKLIRCGRLYDGTCDAMHSNWEILVEDDRIQEVGARVTCPEGTKVIDLSDCTVTPGMIDAHVHFQHVNWQVRNRDAVYKGGVWRSMAYLYNARKSLYRGFTSIRCIGGSTFDYYGGIAAKNMINQGYFDGARLIVMPYYCCTPGSHGDHSQYLWENPYLSELQIKTAPTCGSGADFFRNAVRKEIKYGADFAKVFVNGGVSTPHDAPDDESMTKEEMAAVIETAHGLRVPVTAHVYSDQTMQKLLNLGIDGMEHGSFMTRATASRFEDSGTYLVPTLCCLNDAVHPDPEKLAQKAAHYREKLMKYSPQYIEGRKVILSSNIKLGYGTDFVANYHPYDHGREYECWIQNGVEPYRILRAMTKNNAEILRIDKDLGTIEVGKLADIAAWKRDPMTDPLAFCDCSFVMKNGNIYPTETSL
ncbi:amidohydrolase family protein [Colidextribacter sp. OB.20]|uniref:amidohydrolase family protein n=1 Tax=Colidextribacter sp. OB.20 TaxID=2304568 RepID=UPI00136AD19E|nr:amidohydrolase family protein [Colidextribacter sp. OB.20]NBI11213.1 amidohydrolase family protein [Colidextribacter sp. OB.20]